MTQEFTSTKDFSVGDLFLSVENEPLCFIVKITQWKKGSQYQYELEYFNKERDRWNARFMNTVRLKDSLRYGGWKHIPVVK
jgi:hypothetical protein